MSLEERDWFRDEKLPDAALPPGNWHLVEDADGFRVEHRPVDSVGWVDVLIWLVILVVVDLMLG